MPKHIDGSSSWKPPRQYFAKGNYFHLEGVKAAFRHLVYPAPDPTGGLGVHATIDWSGQSVRFGPDVQWLDPTIQPDEIDLTPDARRADAFYSAIRKYWPALPDDALMPDYAGIRPKLHHPSVKVDNNGGFMDFRILSTEEHGVPGLVHLFGMESPGLTASMAIAEHVAALLEDF
jgi:L-2-hydroxyglutarate oxidase LhgO